MNVKNKIILVYSIVIILMSLVGCAVHREVGSITLFDGSIYLERASVLLLENPTIKLEDVTKVFLKMTADEAEEYFEMEYQIQDSDRDISLGIVCGDKIVTALNENQEVSSLTYWDNYYGLDKCYESVNTKLLELIGNGTLRNICQQENLESCTKEEAIEACCPYAEVLGYQDAHVEVYAVTLDLIREWTKPVYIAGYGTVPEKYGAPGAGYDIQILPWEKKHEFLYLVYQPYLNGILLDDSSERMEMIYVPYYNRVSKVEGATVPRGECVNEYNLISQETAVAQLLLIKGYESIDSIKIENIGLTYGKQYLMDDYTMLTYAVPCWKIHYTYGNQFYSTLIDAVNGGQFSLFGD